MKSGFAALELYRNERGRAKMFRNQGTFSLANSNFGTTLLGAVSEATWETFASFTVSNANVSRAARFVQSNFLADEKSEPSDCRLAFDT